MERTTGYATLGDDRIAYEARIGTHRPRGLGRQLSRTVKDLVVGSDLVFADRGTHHLKGIEGDWQLLAVETAGAGGGAGPH
jgi:hypothetical protein